MWPLRTMLFIPAHKLDWVKKVDRYQPDAVILDLEDAVPIDLKEDARKIARQAIKILDGFGIAPFVRINSLAQNGADDVLAVVSKQLAGVMLPKADNEEEIRELDQLLCFGEGRVGLPMGSIKILPIPETPTGMWAARDLALASSRCQGIVTVMGGAVSGDVARAMGYLPTVDGREQIFLTSKMVLDSRAGDALYPMASIIGTDIDDLDMVRRLALRAKHAGFSGAVLIHPSHVAVAADVFIPSEEEVAYYAGLVKVMEEAVARGDAAIRYKGRMVDY